MSTPLTEAQLTRQVADLLDWALPPGAKFTHIASGGWRHPAVAGQLAAQGVRKGAPDFVIVMPGLAIVWIELKTASGRLSDEQHEWAYALNNTPGSRHFVCRSIDGVLDALRVCGVPLSIKESGRGGEPRAAGRLSDD